MAEVNNFKRKKDRKTERRKDRKTERRKDRKTERQKDERKKEKQPLVHLINFDDLKQ